MKKSSRIILGDDFAADDAQAVNFREVRAGNIAPKTLYRSSHPIKDNKQEKIISLLAARARIDSVVNLSDTSSGIFMKAPFAPWYNKLLVSNRVIALGMDFSVTGKRFGKKLKKGLQFIAASEGPWLVHCHAGVDRTGFFSIVLEALMGAAVDEIAHDYLLSFNSIFDSSIHGDVNKKDLHVVMRLLSVMGNGMEINDQNLQSIAEHYLLTTIKLSAVEIDVLKKKLAGGADGALLT